MERPEWALNPQKWARAIGKVGIDGDVRSEYLRIGGKFERGVVDFPTKVEESGDEVVLEEEVIKVEEVVKPAKKVKKVVKKTLKHAKPTPKPRPKTVKKAKGRK